MAGGTVIPNVPPQFFDNNGEPAVGYKLFTYAAGTTTKLATFTNADLDVATHSNTNPIVLDSAGRATIFLAAASYKFVLATPTAADPPSGGEIIWTRDDVSAAAPFFQDINVQGTAGVDLSAGDGVYMSAGDGGLTAGRWYKWDADFTYASSNANGVGMVQNAIATGVTGSIRIVGRITGLVGLTAGTPYYISKTAGALTASGPPNARTVGVADSATSILLTHTVIPQQDTMAQAGEDITEGNAVYLSQGLGGKTAGRWYKTDSDDAFASVGAVMVGVSKMTIASGATGPITINGRMGGLTLVAGTAYYADATAGAVTATAPANARLVGIADSQSSLRLMGGAQSDALLVQRKVMSSNVTVNNSTVLVDATGLGFAIGASETWTYTMNLYCHSDVAADLKLHMTFPTTPTTVVYGVTGAGNSLSDAVAFDTIATISISTQGVTVEELFIVKGIIVNSTNAGTVQLQFAQQAADASNTVIFGSSYLVAERILGQP